MAERAGPVFAREGAPSMGDTLVWDGEFWSPGAPGGGGDDLSLYLGKTRAAGLGGHPTFFDPAQNAWTDGGLLQLRYVGATRDVKLMLSSDDESVGASEIMSEVLAGIADRQARLKAEVDADGYGSGTYFDTHVFMARDGSSSSGYVKLATFNNEYAGMFYDAAVGMSLGAQAMTGQVAPLLELKTENSAKALSVTPTGAIDFFEQANPGTGDPGLGVMARVYSRDNGAGKAQLCVVFPTGAVQVLATEP